MKTPSSRVVIDLTWLALLAITGLSWLVFDGTLAIGPATAVLMALMTLKGVLILASFMDLARQSRLTLAALGLFLGGIGVGITMLS